MLVDVETRRPVDVLPERSADGFAAWLAGHPGAQLICRDRAGCYPDGASRGAPDAPQVADRWHLWHNLGEAVEKAVARHRQHLAAAQAPTAPADTPPAAPAAPRRDRTAVRTRTRHADVHRMLDTGHSIGAIAAELGLARNTVRRFARAGDPEELLACDGTGRRASLLDAYEPYLRERWNSGTTNATQLWHEIRERDYRGGYSRVRDYLAPFRQTDHMPAPARPRPKPRTVASWIMTKPATLPAGDQADLDAILAASPELTTLTTHVRAFADLMTQRRGRDLEQWMTAAAATGEPALQSFVTVLRADQDAFTAGLTLRWSSGSVEGHINRVKMLSSSRGRLSPRLSQNRT